MVTRMLYEFEWDIASAIESAQADALSEAMSPEQLKARQMWRDARHVMSDRFSGVSSSRLSTASSWSSRFAVAL